MIESSAWPEASPPSVLWAPEFAFTLGDEVADVARMAGFPPDPEQQMLLDLAFAREADMSVVAFEVGVVCSRQNLKTGFLKQAALGWLFVTEEPLTIWSAHEFGTAQEAFRDMCQLIESTPDLDREVKQIHRGNGDEAIELSGNRRLKFKARTKGGGRGLTGNKVVLDEWMFLRSFHLGALVPTLSSVVNPQLVLAGSAGLVDSDTQRATRDRGRDGDDPALVYAEWSDDRPREGCEEPKCDHGLAREGCALDDEKRWKASNPAMGRRITRDYIAAERRTLPPDEFARERLGWWDEPDLHGRVISAPQWADCLESGSTVAGRVAVAVDVSPDRSTATVAWCGLNADGVPHVEVARSDYGTGWIVEQLAAMSADAVCVVVDTAGGAASLLPALEAAGVAVEKASAQNMTQACGAFFDAATGKGLRHIGQAPLDAALAGARKRELSAAWAWDRKDAAVDLTPLVAVTLALWGWQSFGSVTPSIPLVAFR